jgi:hypothetical protein
VPKTRQPKREHEKKLHCVWCKVDLKPLQSTDILKSRVEKTRFLEGKTAFFRAKSTFFGTFSALY